MWYTGSLDELRQLKDLRGLDESAVSLQPNLYAAKKISRQT